MYDKWVEEVNDGKLVGVLVCDQSAAFDLCDHFLLIEKLRLMGLEESTLSWVRSYLSDRQQSCYVDGHLSAPLSLLQCGVPQGSIGGPLLWLCFTCDQPDVVHDHEVDAQEAHHGCDQPLECGEMVGYVDDGAFTYSHRDPAVLSQVLTRKYTMLEDWMSSNKLVVNQDKTHLLVMGTKKMAAKRNEVSMRSGQFTINPTIA